MKYAQLVEQSKALESDNTTLRDHADELEEKLDKVKSELEDVVSKESAEALKQQHEEDVKEIEHLGNDLQSSKDELTQLKEIHEEYKVLILRFEYKKLKYFCDCCLYLN